MPPQSFKLRPRNEYVLTRFRQWPVARSGCRSLHNRGLVRAAPQPLSAAGPMSYSRHSVRLRAASLKKGPGALYPTLTAATKQGDSLGDAAAIESTGAAKHVPHFPQVSIAPNLAATFGSNRQS
jgi:hypothetical protein